MRLGQGECAEGLAAEHRRQPARVLLGAAPGHDRVLRQDVDRQRDRAGHVGRPELFHHERPAEVREPRPADRLGKGCGGEPQLAHLREQRAVEPLGLIPLDGARRELARGEVTGGRLEEPLLLGQAAGHRPAAAGSGRGYV